MPLPVGTAGAELAVVLEFLQVHSHCWQGQQTACCAEAYSSWGRWLAGAERHRSAFHHPPPAPFLPGQVFGGKLGFRAAPPLAPLAAELLQHPEGAAEGAPLLCPSPEDSLVGVVHCRLLELVSGPGVWLGAGGWPGDVARCSAGPARVAGFMP